MARRVVVLPAPLVPSSVTIDSLGHLERHALDRGRHVMIGDLDVRELEERAHGVPRSGRRRKGQRKNQLRARRQMPTSPSGSKMRKAAIRRPNAPNLAGKR